MVVKQREEVKTRRAAWGDRITLTDPARQSSGIPAVLVLVTIDMVLVQDWKLSESSQFTICSQKVKVFGMSSEEKLPIRKLMEKRIKFYTVKEKMEPYTIRENGVVTHQMVRQRITVLHCNPCRTCL